MIDEVRTLTNGKPVRYIVNTHWHPDHWLGNAAYLHAYPAATIVSTEFTREEIRRRGPRVPRAVSGHGCDVRAVCVACSLPASRKTRAALQPTHEPTTPRHFPMQSPRPPGWLSATIEAPTLTFDRALHVHLGIATSTSAFSARKHVGRRRRLRHEDAHARHRRSRRRADSIRVRLILSRLARQYSANCAP